jgi:hypothetical protein
MTAMTANEHSQPSLSKMAGEWPPNPGLLILPQDMLAAPVEEAVHELNESVMATATYATESPACRYRKSHPTFGCSHVRDLSLNTILRLCVSKFLR